MLDSDKHRANWFSAEMLIAYECAKKGWVVSVPLAPCAYDLLVDVNGRICRLQVKRAQFRKQKKRKAGWSDRDHYYVQLVRSRRKGNGEKIHKRIQANAFDYLIAVCESRLIYVIPTVKLVSDNGELLRCIMIKLPIDGRKDSETAGLRWERFRNNFEVVADTSTVW